MKNLQKCTESARTHLVRAKRIVRKSFKMWQLYLGPEIGLRLTIFVMYLSMCTVLLLLL